MIDNLDGYAVRIDQYGTFYITLAGGGDVNTVSAPTWEGLKFRLAEHFEYQQEQAKARAEQAKTRAGVNARRAWVMSGDHRLIEVSYRGKHASTGAPLLTYPGGSKSSDRTTVYVDLTEQDVTEVNARLTRLTEVKNDLNNLRGMAVQDQDLRAYVNTDDGLAMVVESGYGRTRQTEAREPFEVVDGMFVIADHRQKPVDTFQEMSTEYIRRMHPHYDQPIWVVNRGTYEVRGPFPYGGDSNAHIEDDERAYALMVFLSAWDAQGYARLLGEQDRLQREHAAAMALLPQV